MYDFPIKYYEDNLIFNNKNNTCWACYKINGFNYDYLSDEKKIQILNRLTRFVANIGIEAKILIIPIAQNIEGHYNNLTADINKKDELYKSTLAHAKGTRNFLEQKMKYNSSNDYGVYIITKLTNPKSTKRVLDDFIKRPMKSIEEFLMVDSKDILESEIKSFKDLANEYLKQQDKRISLSKTNGYITQWLIRRMLRRGQVETKTRKNYNPYSQIIIKDGEKAIRPETKDILTLTEGFIDTSGSRYLEITGSDGKTSYQTFLAISFIPDDIEFPGGEWLLLLQDYPIPSEVCIHINTVEHKASIKKISGKKREIKSQIEHVQENDEVPDELLESKESADLLEAELKNSRAPLTRAAISICVAADNKEEMEDRVIFIKERYEDFNFMIERPLADQFRLFMEFIPGAERYLTDYILPLPPQTLAGGMFGATRLLGDNIGPYIGTTGILEKMVFLTLARACLLNRSASAALLGTLGGGKSFNANLLMYLNIMYGGKGLIFDPKGERSRWIIDIPELREYISITTLSSDKEDQGKLDPFIIYRDNLEEAGELALNILTEIFKIKPQDDEYTAILEAIRLTKIQEKPCMDKLAQLLSSFPDTDELKNVAQKIGRRIKLLREAGMAKLLFGTGDEKGLDFDNRLNILQIQNLNLPDPETPKEDYTQEETLSTVLMLPIASFAKKFSMSDRSVFKLVLFDESWGLSATSMGIKLMNFLARMGRSLNAGCIFIGHSVSDLKGEGIKNAISYKFCFKTTEIEEVKRVLNFLDLEETEDNIVEIKSLGNGECLFQDLDGRVGKLKFDAVFEHLIKAFNTTPDGKAGD